MSESPPLFQKPSSRKHGSCPWRVQGNSNFKTKTSGCDESLAGVSSRQHPKANAIATDACVKREGRWKPLRRLWYQPNLQLHLRCIKGLPCGGTPFLLSTTFQNFTFSKDERLEPCAAWRRLQIHFILRYACLCGQITRPKFSLTLWPKIPNPLLSWSCRLLWNKAQMRNATWAS